MRPRLVINGNRDGVIGELTDSMNISGYLGCFLFGAEEQRAAPRARSNGWFARQPTRSPIRYRRSRRLDRFVWARVVVEASPRTMVHLRRGYTRALSLYSAAHARIPPCLRSGTEKSGLSQIMVAWARRGVVDIDRRGRAGDRDISARGYRRS